jgi:hypothetical protein
MSEYQYYEFQAVDRPLTPQQMAELRALSTRATITSTRFTNVYHWGNFRGDPVLLMERYFDAFVYVTNWGTHEAMLRLPRRLLDLATAAQYGTDAGAQTWATPDHVVVAFRSEDESGDDTDEGEGWLTSLLPVRAELAGGDLRGLYLGWLGGVQAGELEEDALEPPLPPGLGTLSGALQALADFLRLDADLLAVAAAPSAPLTAVTPARPALERWLGGLAETEKTALLIRLVADGDPSLRPELLQRFQRSQASGPKAAAIPSAGGRTVAQLVATAERRTAARQRAAAERAAAEQARHARERAAARAVYLDHLAEREADVWEQVEALIATKRPTDYDRAVQLLRDLSDLAARTGQRATFAARLGRVRERHAKKVSLLERLERAGLTRRPGADSR